MVDGSPHCRMAGSRVERELGLSTQILKEQGWVAGRSNMVSMGF